MFGNDQLKFITGKRIKKLRLDRKLTLEELGKIFEPPASKGLVGNWEKGRNSPNRLRLQKLSEFFNVSLDYLLGNDEIDNPDESSLMVLQRNTEQTEYFIAYPKDSIPTNFDLYRLRVTKSLNNTILHIMQDIPNYTLRLFQSFYGEKLTFLFLVGICKSIDLQLNENLILALYSPIEDEYIRYLIHDSESNTWKFADDEYIEKNINNDYDYYNDLGRSVLIYNNELYPKHSVTMNNFDFLSEKLNTDNIFMPYIIEICQKINISEIH